MKRILSVLGLAIALSFGTAAFAQTEGHTHHAQAAQSPSKVTRSDGSTVETVIAPDGTKTEVRVFQTGDIARITRTTKEGDVRAVVVEYRDGRKVDLTDENDIEQAMDATADVMLAAADKAINVTKTAGEEVADKTEDVADKTVDVTKEAVDKTKDVTKDVAKETVDTTKKVGEKAEDVADKTVDKTKEAGKVVADKTEDVVDKTGEVAVKGVRVAKEAGKDVAEKSEDVADKTKTESVSFGRKVGRGFKRVGGWFKSIFD
ncbi:MAG TPA: hypothetical protein VKA70_19015 [Blastocatellia bacterium]|nr:hypothetical protein [Blastocatellia bacterium]